MGLISNAIAREPYIVPDWIPRMIPAAIGILLSSAVQGFGALAGNLPGALRAVLHFAAQGALVGAAIPLVAAVGALLYGEMASTLGGEEAT